MEGFNEGLASTTSPAVFAVRLCLMGWSEIIDSRWRRQVEKGLRSWFGSRLSDESLAKAISVVLSPDEELPEEKYEYHGEIY